LQVAPQRGVVGGEQRADLEEIRLVVIAGDVAVRQPDAAVIGLDVMQARLIVERLHFRRREGEPERFERVGLRDQRP
jgi:hypothetical protein